VYTQVEKRAPKHLNAYEWLPDGDPVSGYEAFMRARPAFRSEPKGKNIFIHPATKEFNVQHFQKLADIFETMIVVYAADKNNMTKYTRITQSYFSFFKWFAYAFVPQQWMKQQKVPPRTRPVYLLHTPSSPLERPPNGVKQGPPVNYYQPLLQVSQRPQPAR
jgi:hypothetical protein